MNHTAFVILASKRNCGQCKKTFDQPWLIPSGKPYPSNLAPNGEVMAHWEQTHGFPHEMFIEELEKALNRKNEDPLSDAFKEAGIEKIGDIRKFKKVIRMSEK